MPYLGEVVIVRPRDLVPADESARWWFDVGGPSRLAAQVCADAQPHVGPSGTGGLHEQVRHPRQDVVGGVGLADPFAEFREHLVRGGAPAVDQPVGEPGRSWSQPEEGPGEERRDDDRRHVVGATDADQQGRDQCHDDEPQEHERDDQHAVLHRLADHQAHVPQAVPEDRDEVGARHPHQERDDEEHEQRQEERRGFGVVAEERSDERSDEAEEQARAGDRCHEDEEPHLFSQGSRGSAIALADRDHGGERRDQRDDRAERDERAWTGPAPSIPVGLT